MSDTPDETEGAEAAPSTEEKPSAERPSTAARTIPRSETQDRMLRATQAKTFKVLRGWAGVPVGMIIGEGTRRPAPRGQRLLMLLRQGWIEPVKRRGRPRRLDRPPAA